MKEEMKKRMIDITLVDTQTGERVTYEDEHYFDDESDGTFIWEDGNFACDCNRSRFFKRALRLGPEVATAQCGDGRYTVCLREKDGRVLYQEAAFIEAQS